MKLKKLFCLPLLHNRITAAKFKSKMETILETLEAELSNFSLHARAACDYRITEYS